LDPRGRKWQETGEDHMMRSSMTCTLHHVARMGEMRNAYNILAGKPEGKGPLGSPKRRWDDNIKMDRRDRV